MKPFTHGKWDVVALIIACFISSVCQICKIIACNPILLYTPCGGVCVCGRSEQLSRLRSGEVYDVLVIGGGATGCGIALDSALRGSPCTHAMYSIHTAVH